MERNNYHGISGQRQKYPLDNLFDLNSDGKIGPLEEAIEINFLTQKNNESLSVEEENRRELLLIAGLDPDEVEFMDEDERREAFEETGLDPDDFNMF